ncbi:flagellar basal-body rod protein FlgF [Cypionkella aquatica]|uniref:Flagellar basal-body rod protein FlgF n=1 Tax=Cypionkella aquatica TaxID=1756042 RepID=A0AA37WY61_9RHOB|nr:flagellar hook-basal body complex protein [Cypionkella aquatica]GLS85188.1 flagellar basal-body rod protein FlgF [Cypionkella aquatica]
MDSAYYTSLTRQSGLMREMQVVANNIANISTTGFRREGVVFEEYIKNIDDGPSLSMATGNARVVDLAQAGVAETGGTFDLAIQGDGFFQVQSPDGPRLTRAGSFTPSATGEMVTNDGYPLLDEGGTAVVIPADVGQIAIAQDGSVSANGVPLAKIGLWQPADPLSLQHQSGTLFSANAMQPATGGVIMQGYLEDSNVQPVQEIARMIEVQRAYELGQSFMDQEDKRMRGVIDTLGR